MEAPEDAFFVTVVGQVHRLTQRFKRECEITYSRYIDIHHDSMSQRAEMLAIRQTDLLECVRQLVHTGMELAETLNVFSEHVREDRIDDPAQINLINAAIKMHREATATMRRLTQSMTHLIESKG